MVPDQTHSLPRVGIAKVFLLSASHPGMDHVFLLLLFHMPNMREYSGMMASNREKLPPGKNG